MYFFFLFSNNKMWPLSKSLFNRMDRVFAKNILDFHNKVVKNKNHKYLSPCCYIKYFVTFKSLMGKYCKKIRKWKCKILKDNMPNQNYFCTNLLFWAKYFFLFIFKKCPTVEYKIMRFGKKYLALYCYTHSELKMEK